MGDFAVTATIDQRENDMKTITASTALAICLASCGGGGSTPPTASYSLTWGQESYTIKTTPGNTQSVSVNAVIYPTGSNGLPGEVSVDISPSGSPANPTPGNGPWWMNSAGQIPVQFFASPGMTGSYPIGPHDYTAVMHIGAVTYTAKTTIVVQ